MMSMVEEFPANDKCLALRSRLFPDAWERPTSCDWWDSTKPNKLAAFPIKLHARCFSSSARFKQTPIPRAAWVRVLFRPVRDWPPEPFEAHLSSSREPLPKSCLGC